MRYIVSPFDFIGKNTGIFFHQKSLLDQKYPKGKVFDMKSRVSFSPTNKRKSNKKNRTKYSPHQKHGMSLHGGLGKHRSPRQSVCKLLNTKPTQLFRLLRISITIDPH